MASHLANHGHIDGICKAKLGDYREWIETLQLPFGQKKKEKEIHIIYLVVGDGLTHRYRQCR